MKINSNYFAYLIMAHENSIVLKNLLHSLDDSRNDIYIHIDSKVCDSFRDELMDIVCNSNIFFISKRINVFWANISQVEAEYELFEEAYKKRKYTYYHLISGADLPIKNQDYIHSFFKKHNGKEFLGFSKVVNPDKVIYINLFPFKFKSSNVFYKKIRNLVILIQKYIKCNQLKKMRFMVIKKGTNWASLTDACVEYLIQNKLMILSELKYSKSPDEVYKQTLVFNSPFMNSVYSYSDEFLGCMRLIDWERGKPYTWVDADFPVISASDKLFCRKISNDPILINKILNMLDQKI